MTVTVATANVPHRLRPHKADLQRLADSGAEIICTQEQTDTDPKATCPRGWRYYRPKAAQSSVVYWDPARVTAKKKGWVKISSPGKTTRGIVWVHFGTKGRGQIRVGGVHLAAFKTRGPRQAKEYRAQEKKAAAWLAGGKNRVLAGDINGSIPSKVWTPNLTAAGRWSKRVASGPKGTKIDYVGASKRGPWRVVSTELGPKGRSDHRPVLVTFEWVPN